MNYLQHISRFITGLSNLILTVVSLPILLFFLNTQFVQSQTHDWQRTNPGGGGWFGCVGASKSGIVLAGSDLSGAYRSKDGGRTWDVCGASRGFKVTHVSGIGFHRTNGNIMFIAGGGIYKTTNGGDSWTNVMGGGGYVTDIEFGTDKAWIGYASRHEGNWNTLNAQIYKTTNTGNSWSRIDNNFPSSRIIKLVVNPKNVNIVYAVTGSGRPVCSEADVYKSTNGGVTWQNITTNNFGGFTEVADLAIDPQNPSTLYITTVKADCANRYWIDGSERKLYKSTNSGGSWTKIQDHGGILFVHPTNSSKITYIDNRAVATWNPLAGTYVSNDAGNTFTKTSNVGTWGTAFHGSTQSTYGGTKDGYGRSIDVDLSNPNNFYLINSQWVCGSKDGGANFDVMHGREISNGSWQSNGADNLVNLDMVISPANPNIIYLALADMGIWRSINKGTSWQNCNLDDSKYGWGNRKGGNFHSVVADPSRENVVWATSKKGYILKSTNKGESTSWVEVNSGIPQSTYVNGLSVDVKSPSNNRTLYATADGDVYKSTSDGNSWSRVLDNKYCQFTAVDQFNSNLVYAGGSKGIWRSTNKGQSWSRLNLSDLPADNNELSIRSLNYVGIYDIDTDPNNANWVYVTVHGKGAAKGLYRSKNKGDTWQKLLTDKYMRKVAIMPKNSNIIYATSSSAIGSGGYKDESNGIWFSNNGGATWSKQNQGAAYTLFNAIDVSNENNPYVLAGSQGTGFQKADVPLPGSSSGISLSFANPSNNQNFTAPASVYVKVNASDNSGSISNVRLDLNNTFIRQEGIAPYEWNASNQNDPQLKNLSAGTYTLKATATDNSGNKQSVSRNFVVNSGSSDSYCGWTKQGGMGLDIAASNNHVYVVGTNNYLYKSNGNGGWTQVNNTKKIKRIDATTNGDVYAIGTDNKVWQWKTSNQWLDKNGTGLDIGIGGDQVFVIGTDNKIRKYNGNGNWSAPYGTGKGRNIDVSSNGTPWIRGMNDRLHQWISSGNRWAVKGTQTISDVGIDPNGGDVVVTGQDQNIYTYEGNGNFEQLTGKGITVTMNSNGVPWLINSGNKIYMGKCAAKNAGAELLNNSPENSLTIYPNPAHDELNVVLTGEIQPGAQILIYHSTGSLIHTESVQYNKLQLSINDLAGGMYILQVINGSEITNKRFIKK